MKKLKKNQTTITMVTKLNNSITTFRKLEPEQRREILARANRRAQMPTTEIEPPKKN